LPTIRGFVTSNALPHLLRFDEPLILDQENEKYPVGFESQGIHDGLAE
jgi:hypothetical protein